MQEPGGDGGRGGGLPRQVRLPPQPALSRPLLPVPPLPGLQTLLRLQHRVSAVVLFLSAVILFAGGSARGAATAGAGPGSAGRGAGRTRPASGSAAPAAPVRNVASFQKIQIISM